jgi:hypothetical protein
MGTMHTRPAFAFALSLVGCAGARPTDGAGVAESATAAPRPAAASYATARAGAPPCGELSKLRLGDAKPLLAGRLLVRSVEGAKDEPLPWNIMSAPDAPTDRSRIYFERGKVGLAVVATERYQRAGADFDALAKKRLASSGGDVVSVKTGDPGLRLVAWLPTATPDASSGTSFLLDGLALHPDGTVQAVQFGTFPEQFTDVDGCRALALAIAATLTPGKRAFSSAAGTRDIAFFDERFRATVPEGWVVSTQPGPDFVVVRLRRLAAFPEPAPELGIAFTHHPPPFDKEGATSTQAGKLVGRPVTWHLGELTNREGKQVSFARGRVDLGHDVADAWINTFAADARAEAIAIAASMTALP